MQSFNIPYVKKRGVGRTSSNDQATVPRRGQDTTTSHGRYANGPQL